MKKGACWWLEEQVVTCLASRSVETLNAIERDGVDWPVFLPWEPHVNPKVFATLVVHQPAQVDVRSWRRREIARDAGICVTAIGGWRGESEPRMRLKCCRAVRVPVSTDPYDPVARLYRTALQLHLHMPCAHFGCTTVHCSPTASYTCTVLCACRVMCARSSCMHATLAYMQHTLSSCCKFDHGGSCVWKAGLVHDDTYLAGACPC